MSEWPLGTNIDQILQQVRENSTTTSEAPTSIGDIVTACSQAAGDLATGRAIVDMLGSVRETVGLARDFTSSVYTEPAQTPIPPIGGGGSIRRSPVAPLKRLTGSSLVHVEEGALFDALQVQVMSHIGVTVAIGIASMIGALIPLTNLSRILEAIHSMYALLDPPEVYTQLRDERLSVEWRRPYRYWVESQLQNNIPPASDLITFLVREQISIDEFKRIMSYWGYSEDIANMYWGSHWILPTTQELYDMHSRGMIDDATLRQQVIINDIHPNWVDNIIELRNRLPTRTEARLMMRRNPLPESLLERIFRNERLHPDYDSYYRQMLIDWDMDTIYGRIVTEATGQFVDGMISEDRLREVCANSLASLNETDHYVKLAHLRREARRTDDQRDMWLALYKKNYQTRESVSQQLLALGYDAIDIGIWLDKAEVDSLPKIQRESVEQLEEQSQSEEEQA